MSGSRLHKFGTVFRRQQGLIKSKAIRWEDRPVWYDIYEAFPPKVEPRFERPVPEISVRNILYPEDIVRAKFSKVYKQNNAENLLNSKWKTDQQLFVETYIQNQRPGLTDEELFAEVEQLLAAQGKKFIKKAKESTLIQADVASLAFEGEQTLPADRSSKERHEIEAKRKGLKGV